MATDSYPVLSHDRKTLFFTSERSPYAVPMARTLTFDDLDRGWRRIENGLANLYAFPAREAGLELK